MPPTAQVNVSESLAWPSLAVTVTLYGVPLAAPLGRVPVIAPVVGLIVRPDGRPPAVNVSESPPTSVAVNVRSTLSPAALTWLPGLVRTGSGTPAPTVQLNVALSEV